jgi:tetratricopeptide (TPR) repeat protein/DNA-binding CsgD family transcriptional regulator
MSMKTPSPRARTSARRNVHDPDDLRARIASLTEESLRLMQNRPAEALTPAAEALKLAELLGDEALIAMRSIDLGEIHRRLTMLEPALEHLERGLSLLDGLPESSPEIEVVRAMAYWSTGAVRHAAGEYGRAMELYGLSLDLARRGGNDERAARALSSLGDLYRILGDYDKAMTMLAESIRLWEKIASPRGQAVAWNNLAIVHCHLRDRPSAIDAYHRSIGFYRECGEREGEGLALSNLGLVLVDAATDGNSQPELGLACLFEALAIHREGGNRRNEAGTLDQIGYVYTLMREIDRAEEYLRLALALYEELGMEGGCADALRSLGENRLYAGKPEEGAALLERGLGIVEAIGYRSLEPRLRSLLAVAYEEQGYPARALEQYRLFMALKEEIEKEETRMAIGLLRTQIDAERVEREREVLRMKAEHLEQETALKSRELTTMALHLAQKSELLSSLREELMPVIRGKREGMELARIILSRINEGQHVEGEWSTFERQFHQVHPGFRQLLVERYPALTPAEVKVCTLLKINLSSKEIASMICSNIRTVEKHRQHIRRKMSLPLEVNLVTFLSQM